MMALAAGLQFRSGSFTAILEIHADPLVTKNTIAWLRRMLAMPINAPNGTPVFGWLSLRTLASSPGHYDRIVIGDLQLVARFFPRVSLLVY